MKPFSFWVLIIIAAPAAFHVQAEAYSVGADGVIYESPRSAVKLKLGGRLHIDAARYDGDKTALDDDWIVRRVRLSLRADLFAAWRMGVQYDLIDEEERYASIWLRYLGFDNAHVTVGQFQEPFGLEQAMSSNDILFMERSLVGALMPDDNVGVGVGYWGERWSVAVGFFHEIYIEDTHSFSGTGQGMSGRITLAPQLGREKVLHLGLSTSYRTPAHHNRLRVRATPESEVSDVHLIDTGAIRHVEDSLVTGVEAAIMSPAVLSMAEYVKTVVRRQAGYGDEHFAGGYLAIGVLFNGEQRRYSVMSGAFGGVRPRSGGAWEVTARHGFLDLDDSGTQIDTTWGVTWYPRDALRFMFNYIRVDTDAAAGDDDPRIFQFRAQWTI